MSQELIYTSAPRGLKPGSRGFCTVVSTFGMPANLAQRLESLSGYRHVYGPQDAEAHLNPVDFSHLLLTVGGRPYHVLSRIADAGLDYSQRTNKLAHHVVLDVAERVPGGPAWLLRQPGFVETAFDGEPRVLQAGRKPPSGDETPGVCHHWARLTGDAGWGGALAEAAALGRKTFLVFRPGMELLPLLAESFALLPPERRWAVTFSTYFTGLPPGVDCQVACVVPGSSEHARIHASRNALVIDLCVAMGPAPDSAHVAAGRSGDLSVITASVSPRAGRTAATAGGREQASAGLEVEAAQAGGTGRGTSPPESYDVTSPPLGPPRLQRSPTSAPRRFRRKQAAKWPYVVLPAAATLILLLGGAALWIATRGSREVADAKPPRPFFETTKERADESAEIGPEAPSAAKPEEPSPEPSAQSSDTTELREEADNPAPATPDSERARTEGGEPHTSAEPEAADDAPERLTATQPEQPAETPTAQPTEPATPVWPEAVEIVSDDGNLEQDIVGPGLLQRNAELDLVLIGPRNCILDVSIQKEGAGWSVCARSDPIATFAFQEGSLRFKWKDTPRNEWRQLRNYLLIVGKQGSEKPVAKIPLRRPIEAPGLALEHFVLNTTKVIGIAVPVPDLNDKALQHLRWEFVQKMADNGNGTRAVLSNRPDGEWCFKIPVDGQANEEDLSLSATVSQFEFFVDKDTVTVKCKRNVTTAPSLYVPHSHKRAVAFDVERIKRLAVEKAPQDIESLRQRKGAPQLLPVLTDDELVRLEKYDIGKRQLQRVEGMFAPLKQELVDYCIYLDYGDDHRILLVKTNKAHNASTEP